MARITINGISIDPEAQGPALAGAGLAHADSAESNYILVQTTGPLAREQREQLAATGAEVLEYVPENTYICHFAPADLGPIRALPFVEWANIYLKGFKVEPRLRADAPAAGAANLLALGPLPRSLAQPRKTVEVVLHRDAELDDALKRKIAAAAGVDPVEMKVESGKVRLTVSTRRLADLAAIDEVRQIEEYAPKKLFNNVAEGILRADLVHAAPLNLQGQGQVVAVADTGFDKGSRTDAHPAFSGRVKKLYALGRQSASDPHGHGTHVAGSVLGNGSSAAMGGPIRGMAPKARLVLQSTLDSNGGLGGLPADLHDLFGPPYANDGARVHTNSWGDVLPDGSYRQNCFELDDFVWNHRDCVILFAAGNDGTDHNADGTIDSGSVSPPGTAKNCITIGASESLRPSFLLRYGDGWPHDFPASPIAGDLVANNPNGMVAFSSRGPTRDGRIKPDVTAPGTSILSTRSRLAQVNDDWGISNDPLFFFDGGTSMATPLVAGCAAVVREFFLKKKNHPPSAALVKAMLINGARDLSGQYVPSESGAIPNNAEGFGRVDLAATVGPLGPNEVVDFKDEATALDTGQEEHTAAAIAAPNRTLKVTLVWTDPPGEVLQNDLDLIVRTANGQEFHGNVAAGSADFDRVNNVEQVVIANAPVGNADVIVRAHRIALHPQSYALVIRTS